MTGPTGIRRTGRAGPAKWVHGGCATRMMPPMARAIVVSNNGVETRFGFSLVNRARLYGQRKRVVVDEAGQPTVGGWLTTDGAMLLLPGGRAELYLDDAGDVVDRSALETVDADGNPVPRLDSTLDVPQALRGPIPPERLLEFVATSVYELTPEDVANMDPELRASLALGAIWETDYNYMAAFERQTLFILQNDEGIFGLVAEPAPLELVTRASQPAAGEDPLGDDELDFAMF